MTDYRALGLINMKLEKEKIEEATANVFIEHFNNIKGSNYRVVEWSDAPDVRCEDDNGNKLNLEITLTEDRPFEIPAILGRSNHKSVSALRNHLDQVKIGKANPLDRVSVLSDNVSVTLMQSIMKKCKKDYGANVALVIRDSSPVGWDWELVVHKIRKQLKDTPLRFQHGIWIVTYSKDRIIQIV